jgi:glycosyltransferase involved in cell wall biosynthesis
VTSDPASAIDVMVVEDNAHSRVGHYPTLFAQLARNLAGQGMRTEALTQRGWALVGTEPVQPFNLSTFGPIAQQVMRLATLAQVVTRDPRCRVRDMVRTVAITGAAADRARRTKCSRIVVTSRTNILLASVLARSRSWVLYCFEPPHRAVQAARDGRSSTRSAPLLKVLLRVSKHAQARRVHRGGSLSIVTNTEQAARQWRHVAPWLDPERIPFGAVDDEADPDAALPTAARNPDGHVALCFGAAHHNKDLDTVFAAFARLPDWHLIVAGGGAAKAYRQWSSGACPENVHLVEGYVDNRTRRRLHAEANVAILSFKPAGYQQDSATLADAISAGTPVVCSTGTPAAEIVDRYALGCTFESGSVEGLIGALASLADSAPVPRFEAARAELGIHRVVETLLARL